MNRSKLIKMFIALIAIVVLVASLTRLFRGDSMSLTDYARLNATPEAPTHSLEENNIPDLQGTPDGTQEPESPSPSPEAETPSPENASGAAAVFQLTGASLNGASQLDQRYTLEDAFYYEPLSDNLRRYITGISYPVQTEDTSAPEITLDELRYVHILHYDFDGNPAEGELICNEAIAQDIVEIFYELYRSEYQLERVLLIDEYNGDDTSSMEDNNTSCFNYRLVEGTSSLSKHALGLAIDVNPFYNPYVTYSGDGSENISPEAAAVYADRSAAFPYKIDEDDLCYKLFTQHGFIWGGNWNSSKDYQHFQKAID